MQEAVSLSSTFLREWKDRIDGRTVSVSIATPVLPPPTLRVKPVDVLGIPSDFLDAGSRVYLLELIGDFLPRRMAVRCGPTDSFQMMVERVGLRELCALPRNSCFLVHADAAGTRIWTGQDIVRERHGTAFQLVVEQIDACMEPSSEEASHMMIGFWQHEMNLQVQAPDVTGHREPEPALEPLSLYQVFLEKRAAALLGLGQDDPDDDLDELVQQHLQWHHTVTRIDRLTTLYGFEDLHAEALAYRRSRGSWPCLVVSGLIQEIVLFLDIEFDEHLDFQSQTVKALIRSRVEPRVSLFSRVTMAAVRPPLTVREQDDSDDLYVLIGEELNPSSSLVMVVIWDHRQDESVDLHPLELPQRMMTEMLLEEVGMGRRCGLPFVECVVKHSEHELPLLISWRPFPGMKIVIDVGIKRCDIWQQDWSAGLSAAAASDFSLDGEVAWLMQRRILLRNNYDVLRQYAAGWTTTTVELTFWFHNTVEERIQQHPAKAVFSVVTSDFQEDDFAQLIPRDGEIVPVDPAPILLALPRPHILVLGVVAHQYVPVLCKVNIEGRQNLMSILVDSTYPPVSVDAIFDLVMPDHLCRSAAICHALYRDERKQFYHDIELQKGDFIELFSWFLDDDQTSCGDDSPESISSDEIWDSSVMPHPSVLPEDINGDADLFSLMQTNPQTDRGVRIDAGHQLRMESDLLYRAVASSSDHTLASVPQGGTAKLWLLAAEANGLHDTVIRVELRHQVPDWTGWVCGSWRNRPPGIRFAVMTERPPPISSENNDMLILGASARDMEQGKRVLLMDLIYSNVLRRGAVRFGILMTVAEIVRLFAGRSIPIDSPLLFAFEMYWFSPAGVRVYTASEIPSVPDGSYVRVVEKANPCRNAMRPLSPDPELVRWAEAAGTQTHESDAADNLDQDSMGLLQKSIKSDVRDNTATLDIEEMDGSRQDGRPYGLRPPLFRCYVFWCHQIADMLRPPGNTTVFWLSTDLDDLDDWVVYHGALFIIDSKFTSEKQVLSLNDRLDLPDNTPRGNEKVQPFEIALPDFTPFFDIIFQKRPKMDIVWEAVILALPEAVRVEAQELVACHPTDLTSISIFTDGSWMPEPGDHAAAWAVIVIGHGTGGDFTLDCDYGLVVSEPMEQGWTGAQVSDARAAETAALIRAIEWTIYSGMEKPICFCFDAAAVGFAGTGTFRTGEADRHGRILRAMVAAIEKFLPPNCQPKWQHVKGHQGNVGNELADVVAKRCFRLQTERTLVARPDYVPYVCGKKFAIELLWLLFVQFRQCPSFPEISGHSMIMPQLRQPSDWTARVPTRLRQPTCYEEKSAFFRLFFCHL